jgi:hypothetical protein
MNTKKGFSGIMIASALAMLFMQSCSKEDTGSVSETDLALAQDEVYSDALYAEVDNMVVDEITTLDANTYYAMGMKSTSKDGECSTVTVDHPDSTSFPKVITIDYGEGCTIVFRNDTITRKGQIKIVITDRWFMPEAENIVTFNNFYLNNVKIEGTRTITNMGLNNENHLLMGIVLEGGKITFNDSTRITREANHIREWIRHDQPRNDTLIITGSASGINVLGETYHRVITEPLVMVHCPDYHWRWVIVDGKVEITNSTSGTTAIDYSAVGCDGSVNVNKNGYHHNYAFNYKHRHNKGGQ